MNIVTVLLHNSPSPHLLVGLKKKIEREIEPTAEKRKYNTDERSIDIDTQSDDNGI